MPSGEFRKFGAGSGGGGGNGDSKSNLKENESGNESGMGNENENLGSERRGDGKETVSFEMHAVSPV